jgi:hypothetical protein
LRFFKGLKAEGEQRIQRHFVGGVGFVETLRNRRFEGGEVSIVLRVERLFLDELPQPFDEIDM